LYFNVSSFFYILACAVLRTPLWHRTEIFIELNSTILRKFSLFFLSVFLCLFKNVLFKLPKHLCLKVYQHWNRAKPYAAFTHTGFPMGKPKGKVQDLLTWKVFIFTSVKYRLHKFFLVQKPTISLCFSIISEQNNYAHSSLKVTRLFLCRPEENHRP